MLGLFRLLHNNSYMQLMNHSWVGLTNLSRVSLADTKRSREWVRAVPDSVPPDALTQPQ